MLSEKTSRAVFVIVAMLAGVAAVWQSLSIPAPQFEPVGGARVPQVAAALTIVLGLAFLARSLATRSASAGRRVTPDRRGYAFVALFAVAAVALASGVAGFALVGGAFLVATQALYRTSRYRWLVPATFLFLAAVALELLFTRVFVIDLPRTF